MQQNDDNKLKNGETYRDRIKVTQPENKPHCFILSYEGKEMGWIDYDI